MNERDKLASQPLSGDADLPLDVRRDLMAAATANGSISYYWLCDVYRRGRSGDADLLPQLIEKWREFAAFEVENANHQSGVALYQCADELEAALSTLQVKKDDEEKEDAGEDGEAWINNGDEECKAHD